MQMRRPGEKTIAFSLLAPGYLHAGLGGPGYDCGILQNSFSWEHSDRKFESSRGDKQILISPLQAPAVQPSFFSLPL